MEPTIKGPEGPQIEVNFRSESRFLLCRLSVEGLDRLEEKHTLFGGGIESIPFEHLGIRKKSALEHTMDAAGTRPLQL
jgi:hypothetical protein